MPATHREGLVQAIREQPDIRVHFIIDVDFHLAGRCGVAATSLPVVASQAHRPSNGYWTMAHFAAFRRVQRKTQNCQESLALPRSSMWY
ncbi:hypothetical protein RE6C_03210 [Rhodopirellula europaea 6C]|uniref:Uncharacterized protein n=1 Tax=Rhodopirellula europaea 6C TaxID=1263867 RepID=M2B1I1_9BACT|nr:hypothetical protein RE6C_03210 [Rhodopirellula europaea 6C]